MAIARISLLESLRPWHYAGVTHFLSADTAVEVSETEDTDHAAPDEVFASSGQSFTFDHATLADSSNDRRQGDMALSNSTASESSTTPDKLQSPAVYRDHTQYAGHPVHSKGFAASSATHGRQTEGQLLSATGSNATTPQVFTGPWRLMLERCRPSPLAWTYLELAQDLLAPDSDSTNRSSVLRRLIQQTGLAKGSSTFWPLALHPRLHTHLEKHTEYVETSPGALEAPQYGSVGTALTVNDRVCFFKGLDILGCRAVIISGPHSYELLFDQESLPHVYTQQIIEGKIFIFLPPLETLLATAKAFDKAVLYLRSALGDIPGFRS